MLLDLTKLTTDFVIAQHQYFNRLSGQGRDGEFCREVANQYFYEISKRSVEITYKEWKNLGGQSNKRLWRHGRPAMMSGTPQEYDVCWDHYYHALDAVQASAENVQEK